MEYAEPTGFLILKKFSRVLWYRRSWTIDPAGPTPSPLHQRPPGTTATGTRARHPSTRAPAGFGNRADSLTRWVRVPGAFLVFRGAWKPRTQWGRGSIEKPGKTGEKGYPVGQGSRFWGCWGQKPLFARTRPLVLYDFEKALIFWNPENRPLEPKGPFVTGHPLTR